MNESELRLHSCCFTGHRPEKLYQPEHEIITALDREIHAAINDGFVTFISGMSRGVDIWAAEIVLQLKSEKCPLRLICAVPFEGFDSRWLPSGRSAIMRFSSLPIKWSTFLLHTDRQVFSLAMSGWSTDLPA